MSVLDKPEFSGTYNLTSETVPSYVGDSLSAFKIQFVKDETSVTLFTSAKACVLTANDVKIFAVVFKNENGVESTVIQIPLVGQTIDDLVALLNTYPDISADVVNSAGFTSTLILSDTAFADISGKWAYFNSVNIDVNSVFSSLDQDIRFVLTSAEPVAIQNNLVQSLGGYVSVSEVYDGLLLADTMSIYDSVMYINPQSLSARFSLVDLQKSEYVQVNDEIMKISKWVGNIAYISERNSFDTPLRMHPKNSIVREISKNDFFDTHFGPDRKQYRCVAIKNINTSDVAKNMKVFFNVNSRNNLSRIRLAIEAPLSDYFAGTASTSGITAFTVTSLVGEFDSSHFVSAPLVFTSGQNIGQVRIVKSYNPTSGTIELDQRLPYTISVGDSFYIDTAPSQRTKSGTKAPSGSRVSAFYDVTNEDNAVSINVGGNRLSGSDLRPNEVVYVWIERSIAESNDEFPNNRFSLSVKYSKV